MGILREVQIVFDGDVDVFCQGDVIKGEVVLLVDGDWDGGLQRVKGVWMQLKGEAKVGWTNTNYNPTDGSTEIRDHSQKEEYLKQLIVLYGTGRFDRDVDNLSIPPGRNSYPFEFQLPKDRLLPQSFEGAYGSIRYTATVTVSLKRMCVNTETKTERPFTMAGPMVDLNTIPDVMVPVKSKITQHGCFGCGSLIERVITIGLPRRGYVPGESIYVTGKVDNRDGEEQIYFDTPLCQRITFRCGTHSRTKENVLCRANASVSCPRGWVTDFAVGPLHVVEAPPSDLPGCELIDIEYFVKCLGCKCKKIFPLIIGTASFTRPSSVLSSCEDRLRDGLAHRDAMNDAARLVEVDSSEESTEDSEPEENAKLLAGYRPAEKLDTTVQKSQQVRRLIGK